MILGINPSLSFLLSFCLHLALISSFFYFSKDTSTLKQDPSIVKKIPRVLKVDIVSMPKLTLEEKEKIKPVSEPSPLPLQQPTPEPKEAPAQETIKEPAIQAESIKKVEVLSKKIVKPTKLKQEKAKKNKLKGLLGKISQKKIEPETSSFQERLQQEVLAGNKISEGNSATGADSLENELSEWEEYASKVIEQIRIYWELPEHLIHEKYKSSVRIFISPQGDLMSYEFVEKSESEEFNQFVVSSLEQAQPFQGPGSKILTRIKNGEFIIHFPF